MAQALDQHQLTVSALTRHMEAVSARMAELVAEAHQLSAEFTLAKVAAEGMLALQQLSARLDAPPTDAPNRLGAVPPLRLEPGAATWDPDTVPSPQAASLAAPEAIGLSEKTDRALGPPRPPVRRFVRPMSPAVILRRQAIMEALAGGTALGTAALAAKTGHDKSDISNDLASLWSQGQVTAVGGRRDRVWKLAAAAQALQVDQDPIDDDTGKDEPAPETAVPTWTANAECLQCHALFRVGHDQGGDWCTKACMQGLDADAVLQERLRRYLSQAGPQKPLEVSVAMNITVAAARNALEWLAMTGAAQSREART